MNKSSEYGGKYKRFNRELEKPHIESLIAALIFIRDIREGFVNGIMLTTARLSFARQL